MGNINRISMLGKSKNNKGFYGMLLPKEKYIMHCNIKETDFKDISSMLAIHTAIGELIKRRLCFLLFSGKSNI